MLCQDCKKKSSCKELCKKAEKWVNQDYVSESDNIVYISGQIYENFTKEVI